MDHSLSKKLTFGSPLLLALLTTVIAAVMSLYTTVDGVFVFRFISTNAFSSVNIVYPMINIVLGIPVMLSMGSNTIMAKKWEKDGLTVPGEPSPPLFCRIS